MAGILLNLGGIHDDTDEQINMGLNHRVQMEVPYALCSKNHDLIPEQGYDTAKWAEPLRKGNVFLDRAVFWFQNYRFRCVLWRENFNGYRGVSRLRGVEVRLP